MSRNGSGTYSAPVNSWNPAINNVLATPADWQAILNDISSALSQSLSKDGQTTATGNLPMGGFKLTGLGNGTNSGDSVSWQQLFGPSAVVSFGSDITVNGLDVGRGSGNLINNVAIGTNALGSTNTATSHVAVGINSLAANTSGTLNTAVGPSTLEGNTTGSRNVAVGADSLVSNTTGSENVAVGRNAGSSLISGNTNTFVGHNSGTAVTTANNHAFLGGFSGNQGGLDVRTLNGWVVLSDGLGNIKAVWNDSGNCLIGTVSDTGEKLQVNGTVKATNFAGSGVNLTGTAASLTAGFVSSSSYLSSVLTASNVETFAHGLGRVPVIDYTALYVSTANNGYSVGDEIHNWVDNQISAADCPVSVVADATNIYVLSGSSTGFGILNKTTAVPVSSVRGNFRVLVNYR